MTRESEAERAAGEPGVWRWYRAYCAALALLYLLVVGLGVVMLLLDRAQLASDEDEIAVRAGGALCAALGAPLCAAFVFGAFVPRRPWGWVYGLVLICVGLGSACCLPASVPLLLFWLKADVKRFFARASVE